MILRPGKHAASPHHRKHVSAWRVALPAMLALVLIVGGLAAALVWAGRSQTSDEPAARKPAPAVDGTATAGSLVPSSAVTAAPETGSSQTTAPVGPGAAPSVRAGARASLVAFRKEGRICVCGENGSGEKILVPSASGVFSLSPDGATVALVDADSSVLTLIEVATQSVKTVGPARQETPSWWPDSSKVAFTSTGQGAMLARRTTGSVDVLFNGSMPSVAPDGSFVAGLTLSGKIVVWRGGQTVELTPRGAVTGLASGKGCIWYGAIDSKGAVLRRMGADGRHDEALLTGVTGQGSVTFGDMMSSPDGTWLAYAEQGDDALSKLYALRGSGGDPKSMCSRRDCYPVRWSADGASLALIEGNAFQGEPTALVMASPEGSRRLLVESATR